MHSSWRHWFRRRNNGQETAPEALVFLLILAAIVGLSIMVGLWIG